MRDNDEDQQNPAKSTQRRNLAVSRLYQLEVAEGFHVLADGFVFMREEAGYFFNKNGFLRFLRSLLLLLCVVFTPVFLLLVEYLCVACLFGLI